MLIDLEPVILSALRNDTELIAILGRDSKGRTKVYPLVAPDISLPRVTFYELVNFDNNYAGDKAVSSEIHFHIDVWHNSNPAGISLAVNRVMEGMGFVRTNTFPMYESDTKTYHRVLRYKKTHLGS